MKNKNIFRWPFITETKKEAELLQGLPFTHQIVYFKIKESHDLDWYDGMFCYKSYEAFSEHLNSIQKVGKNRQEHFIFNRQIIQRIFTSLKGAGLVVPIKHGIVKLAHIKLIPKQTATQPATNSNAGKKKPSFLPSSQFGG